MPDCSISINNSSIEVVKLPAPLSTEECIQLAFTAINNDLSIWQSASSYEVFYSTLNHCLNDAVFYATQAAHQQKLISEKEVILKCWTLQWADWGFPAEIVLFCHMTNHLLHQKFNNDEVLDKCWIENFLKHHPALKSKYSNPFDKKWALTENRKIFLDWFNLFSHQMRLHNIQLKNLYNMNEKGFLMRQSAKIHVMISKHDKHAYSVQEGSWENISILKCVAANSWLLPSFIIFKAKMQHQKWRKHLWGNNIIALSNKGWTDDEPFLKWLKGTFKCFTWLIDNRYQLLIVNDHNSHCTTAAIDFALKH